MQLSPHFTLHEMCRSQIAMRHGFDNQPPLATLQALERLCEAILEPVRERFSRPITPSSGYRCRALNRVLGSHDASQHVKGEAVDFDIAGCPKSEIAAWIAGHLVFDQLIVEYPQAENVSAGWLHVSYRLGRNRREILTKTNNGVIRGFPLFW